MELGHQSAACSALGYPQPACSPLDDPAPPLLLLPLVLRSARGHGCAFHSEGVHHSRQAHDPPDGPLSGDPVGPGISAKNVSYLPFGWRAIVSWRVNARWKG